MKGFPMHNSASALKQTTKTANIDGKKVVTKTYKNRDNAEGKSQSDVLNDAYAKIEQAGLDIDEFNTDPRFDKALSQEELDALLKEQGEIMGAYDLAGQNYSAVSDSLNTVNKNFKIK